MKVSYMDLICTCEACQQYSTKGCEGGSVEKTINYISANGFLGGGSSDEISSLVVTLPATHVWKAPFSFTYVNCLSFFRNYCDWSSTSKCSPTDKQFDKSINCGKKPTTGSDLLCSNGSTDIKITDAIRQKGLITGFPKEVGVNSMKSALVKGPLVATMELYSDIFNHPKDTIYVHRTGGSIGHFAVKIVGYKDQGNETYWMVMLPFDESVGNNGIVWVRAGLN